MPLRQHYLLVLMWLAVNTNEPVSANIIERAWSLLTGENSGEESEHIPFVTPEVFDHPCDRECEDGRKPMECYYKFYVELYSTLNKACYDCPGNITDCDREHCVPGDGVERGIVAINRSMPGPPVMVCQGDKLTVDVVNLLHTETTSMHFHGEHFKGNQYMDGTPSVTQCPILPGASFRLNFTAQIPGTHFYHSHSSFQRGDGAFGPYVVRQSLTKDPHSSLYDYDLTDHVIFVQEWFHVATREAFVLHHWDTGKNKADNFLINGRGRLSRDKREDLNQDSATPNANFAVSKNKRYRFRVVSPGFTLCPVLVSVEKHDLLMIASDGAAFEPLSVRSFIVHPGERYDFVLTADQRPNTYQLRFAGLFDCAPTQAHAVANLHYEEAKYRPSEEDSEYKDMVDVFGYSLNPLNYAPPKRVDLNHTLTPIKVPISDLRSILPEGEELEKRQTKDDNFITYDIRDQMAALKQEKADKVFYLGYDLYPKDNPHYHHEDLYPFDEVEGGNKLRSPQMNNITLKATVGPLLSQESDVSPEEFCNIDNTIQDCASNDVYCECVHRLEVNLNDVVELVLIDEGFPFDVSHPFHLHGHAFFVVSMERHAANISHIGPSPGEGNWILRNEVIAMDEQDLILRNLQFPPLKDTVSVPDGGFTIIRFVADNPGYWLLHCHMSWHNHLGMGIVLKVGDVAKDVGPPPPGFPTCRNFQ